MITQNHHFKMNVKFDTFVKLDYLRLVIKVKADLRLVSPNFILSNVCLVNHIPRKRGN